MEQLLINWFGDLTILIIPLFAGIVCSIIIQALDQATPEGIKGRYLTPIVCLLFGVFLVFGFPNVVKGWFDTILIIALNWGFAVTFYHVGGKKVVDLIIDKALRVVGKKTE